MRIIMFGTYDDGRHPRVGVLREGLMAASTEVVEFNVALRDSTAARVAAAHSPVRAVVWLARLLAAWGRLLWRSRAAPPADAVLVGYLGVLDILVARLRWPRTALVLDHMAPLRGVAEDRRLGPIGTKLLSLLDDVAEAAADLILFDTEENRALSSSDPDKTLVVPVGAPGMWFGVDEAPPSPPLRVVFFGLFTPLQGTPVIGDAIRLLAEHPISFTMIGSGQDLTEAVSRAGVAARVEWIDWVPPEALPALVTGHHVCLGIFGTTPKAERVVPNKVYQGAAAGCAIVTLDSQAQRRVLGDAALYVPAGDAAALAAALDLLSRDVEPLASHLRRSQQVATSFVPTAVVGPLLDALRARCSVNMS